MFKCFLAHHLKFPVILLAGFSLILPVFAVSAAEPLTVFADDINADWPLWDCCAGSTPTVETDDADHGAVAEFSVLGSPDTVQGFFSRDVGTTYTASASGTLSFEMKVVTAPADGTPWIVKLEAAGGSSNTGDMNITSSNEGLAPVTGEWQTYTFNVSAMEALGLDITAIDTVAVFPAWGQGAGAVYRIDNVMFSADGVDPDPEPDPVGEALSVFADDVNAGWPLWDCCGGSTPTVETDDADHGAVAEFSVLGSPDTVQGFDSRDAGTPYAASATGVFSFEMKVVTAPAEGTPWILKMESVGDPNTGDINLSTSKEGLEPVTGAWQTYSFDVATLKAAGLDISAIDVIMVFPAWGQGAGAVYRVDNVHFTIDGGDSGGNGGSSTSGGSAVINIADGINFEGAESEQATWEAFENGDPSAALEFVTNPSLVGNTSNGVAKLTPLAADPCCGKFAGVVTHTVESFALSASNAAVKIWVYKDKISPVGVKFEKFNGNGYGSHGELTASNTLINQWEQLTIDFTSQIGLPETDAITGIAIFPDMVDGRTADSVVYFDEITFNDTGDLPPPPAVLPLTVFADEVNADWPLWDCCAGSTPTVETDDAEHGAVAEFSVLGSADTVQGFFSRDVGTQYAASESGTLSFEMKVVTAPADGTPWIVKLEAAGGSSNTGDMNITSSNEGLAPVTGVWQTYTFDVSAMKALGLDITAIDTVAVFPAWGQGAGAVYRIDNVMFSSDEVDPEPEPDPVGEALSVFADDVTAGWPLWDCCAGSTPTVETDDAEHGAVAEFSVLGSAETVQGFFGRDAGTSYAATASGTLSFEMKVVTAPADGTPWILKLEAGGGTSDTGDINITSSNEGLAPVTGEWQTYTFDISALAALGLDISAIDAVLVFPAWGQGAGAVYRIDNVNFTTGLDPEPEPVTNLILMEFDDFNADGIPEWLGYEMTAEQINVSLLSGDDFVSLVDYSLSHSFTNAELHKLGDRDGDGVSELGVFGFDATLNRYQLVVHDGGTGQKLATWNWPNTLTDPSFVALSDLTADGLQEYGINGIHNVNGTRQLVVKDGDTKATYQTFKWPNLWDNTKVVTMTDVTSDGVPEVALYGLHTRLDKGQLFVYDGADSNTKVDVYNWNKLWLNTQLMEMDDVDGEGTKDWGQFGKRKDDGRYQWVVKKGHDKRGVIRVFSWPADLENVTPMLVADRTGDGVRDVAITGVHSTNGKIYLRINDGKLANTRIANISWPGNWENQQVKELGDLNGDGFNEYAMLGYLKTNGKIQLVIKDGQTLTEYGRHTVADNGVDLLMNSYDVNNDGMADVILSGVDESTGSRHFVVLDGTNLEILFER